MSQHSSYLEKIFDSSCVFKETINTAVKSLRQVRRRKGHDFDGIFCRGVSGLAVAAPVAYRLGCDLVVVRKNEEKSHASYRVEGASHAHTKLLFLDDFTCSGATLANSVEALDECYSDLPSLVGSYFFARGGFVKNESMMANILTEYRLKVQRMVR